MSERPDFGDEHPTGDDEALREAQEGKGYGAGEGERDVILDDDAERSDDE